jgi:hypothetical protein
MDRANIPDLHAAPAKSFLFLPQNACIGPRARVEHFTISFPVSSCRRRAQRSRPSRGQERWWTARGASLSHPKKGTVGMDWWYFLVLGLVLVGLVGFLIFRLMKKPED